MKPNEELVGMIYPGIQHSSNQIASSNLRYFAYSTVEAVYVYDSKAVSLINIIPEMHTSINTITLAPHHYELLAIACYNQRNKIINVKTNEVVANFPSTDPLVSLCWANDDQEIYCFSKYFSVCYVYLSSTGELKTTIHGNFSNLRLCNIINQDPPILVGGNRLGSVTRLVTTKISKKKEYQGKSQCVSLELDPNNSSTCLVAWESEWGIFDVSNSLDLVMHCENYDGTIGCATWSSIIPGQFYTGDFNKGIIRVWNASSDHYLESFPINSVGITLLLSLPKKRLLCGFSDGSIGVWDIETRQFIMKNLAGHTNTIFGTSFLPTSPDILVSVGGDGSVCTWNANSLKQIDRIQIPSNRPVIYSMAISPGSGYIVCGCNKGKIIIFSLKTKNIVYEETVSHNENDKIIFLSFSKFHPSELLITSINCFCCCFDVEKRSFIWKGCLQYNVRSAVYSPHVDGKWAYACKDGKIVII